MARATYDTRSITHDDADIWLHLRHQLWSDASIDDHAQEITRFFAGTLPEPQTVLFAETSDHEIIGLAELSIRQHVPGCQTARVGFIEGLYVIPSWRHRGVARALIRASQNWARSQRCAEFATDRIDGFIVDRRF